ncbi:hypothetical protein C8A01DRAFT_18405 [Parachaetomium inaequale]|uniref:Uncharacterized protein n=1 Tax=Parachaetomium inaequale TaxID=2588326 RepID=A0AAN6PAN0_9PEZI|nr:hypothetical protein C8A01DRAFT_18405 [Parachaetomium inaequale]
MAATLLNCIKIIYQALTQQQKVVNDQEESVHFLQQANLFLDVERLTGVTMEHEIEHLDTTRGILDDLNVRLGQAINLWGQLNSREPHQDELPWPEFPGPRSPEPSVEDLVLPTDSQPNTAPNLADPAVGAQTRHQVKWQNWTEAPTIHDPASLDLSRPTRWWMEKKDHYALCQPSEQCQLEGAARAAQFNRAYPPAAALASAPALVQYPSFAQEVRQAQYRQYCPSALPLPPLHGAHLSYSRRARADSLDFWLDEDFDPEFWQKNLRPGNIWTDLPRHPVPEDDELSPRTVPEKNLKLQVGGTSPSSYFPSMQRRDFGGLAWPCGSNSRR